MISYVPINDNLNIVFQEIKTKKTVMKKEPVNHIWMYDRSGSMWDALPELTKQLITLSKTLPKGDTLTLGWFSGEGDFNFMLKGFKITDTSDYKSVEQVIKANSTTRGCTCFSEVLADTENVLNDLSVISNKFSLHFFTDGYPVVSNYQREVTNIFKAIEKIKDKVTTAMFVGYGSYYNKELMTQMAEKLGALLIHSSVVPEYSTSVTKLLQLAGSAEPKEEIDPVVKDVLSIYTVTDQGVVLHSIDDDGKLYINPQTGKSTCIFYVTREKPNKKSWDKIEVDAIDFADKDNVLAKGLYASALVLTQQTKTDVALEIVGKIGDKAVVDAITNAFTIDEYGSVETDISKCIDDISNRFNNGRDKNYLPPMDSFCVFDLLNILMKDDKAEFFPYHDKFKYERIGLASTTNCEYPKFEADKMTSSPFNKLVWHESLLNLSIGATIKGKVKLNSIDGVTPASLGFDEYFPTHIFRSYTFIKDGRVNIKKFPITSSEQTYMVMKNKGIVVEDTFKTDKMYFLDISKLPAINRVIATGKTSATELCKLMYRTQCLKAQIKAIKAIKEKVCIKEDTIAGNPLTGDQIQFLRLNGIKPEQSNVFSPPVESVVGTDKYVAKSFEIKVAKLMSLPTVKEVMEKIEKAKPLTPVQNLIKEGVDIYESAKSTFVSEDVKKSWFDAKLLELNSELKEVRGKVQESKFAIILGKKWFDEFTSRAETALVVDGVTFNFELGEDTIVI